MGLILAAFHAGYKLERTPTTSETPTARPIAPIEIIAVSDIPPPPPIIGPAF